jgi:hypothetical protein
MLRFVAIRRGVRYSSKSIQKREEKMKIRKA